MKKLIFISFALTLLASCNEGDSGYDPYEQFLADLYTIDRYLTDQAIDAYTDPSGIRFTIEKIGTLGLPPKRTQSVKVSRVGTLFSSGAIVHQDTLTSKVTGLISGLIEALEIFPVGTEATVYIPSALAYGDEGSGIIPQNSILKYQVALLEVAQSSTEKQQFQVDTTSIEQYLKTSDIAAVRDSTGIRYVISELGTGSIPFWYDKIRVTYTGKLLSTGTTFYSGTVEPRGDFDSRAVDFLPGLQALFHRLPAGSKCTAYIPSVLGFGSEGAGGGAVPANANLIYEIQSLEILP